MSSQFFHHNVLGFVTLTHLHPLTYLSALNINDLIYISGFLCDSLSKLNRVAISQGLTSGPAGSCLWPRGPSVWTWTTWVSLDGPSGTATPKSSADEPCFGSSTVSWSCCCGSFLLFSLCLGVNVFVGACHPKWTPGIFFFLQYFGPLNVLKLFLSTLRQNFHKTVYFI